MATHSSILNWEIAWTEEPGGYSLWGHKRVRHDSVTKQQQERTRRPRIKPCLLFFRVTLDEFLPSLALLYSSVNRGS